MTATAATVAAGHPEVCRAAADVLSAGGNAFDAAVAAGFAAAVAEPVFTSLGGGGFLLARTAGGEEMLFDFFADTPGLGLGALPEPHFLPVTISFPASDQVFNVGLGSVAVPGVLPGYLHVHGRLGRLPLGDVLAPAIRLAGEGVALNPTQARLLHMVEPILVMSDAGRAIYTPDDRRLGEGDLLVNGDLAEFLAAVAATGGAHGFHRGELAAAAAADMAAGGGLLTAADLAAYQVVERAPLALTYRGRRILTNPSPSFGGSLIALALLVLEEQEPVLPPWGGPEHVTRLVATMIEVDEDRAAGRVGARLRATRGTTHVSVADGEGNVASMTTSNGEGSGYIVPGTGVMLNNMLGEDDLHPDGFHAAPAGERVASMMSPTLVLDGQGDVALALGSGGSKRIRTALLQVISAVIDHGIDVTEAVAAPRLHWDGEWVQAEPGFAEPALAALRARWPVNVWPALDLYFGGVHAVVPGHHGAGDARRGGAAMVVPG